MVATETLGDRVVFMRESLAKSQTITENMVSILGSFDHRLSSLETAMRPTQVPPALFDLSSHNLRSVFLLMILVLVFVHFDF